MKPATLLLHLPASLRDSTDLLLFAGNPLPHRLDETLYLLHNPYSRTVLTRKHVGVTMWHNTFAELPSYRVAKTDLRRERHMLSKFDCGLLSPNPHHDHPTAKKGLLRPKRRDKRGWLRLLPLVPKRSEDPKRLRKKIKQRR